METIIFDLLTPILGAELSIDLAGYIITIENPTDFDDYLNGLLDLSIKQQRDIFDKIKAVKFNNNRSKQNTKNAASNNQVKHNIQESDQSGGSGIDAGKKQKQQKKYKKFQLSEIHKGYLKEGRNPCECQATKHKLINNCVECGRIVCEQEGSGPCFFCDNMVCTPEEEAVLKSDTKQADQLFRTLTERKKSDTWKKAMQNRDKLLEYDRNNTRQTKIIDDEHDYFSVTNTWSSKKEREKAAKKVEQEHEHKYGSRLGARKIVIDLLGKQAFEENTFTYEEEDEEIPASVTEKRRSFEPYIPDIDSVLNALRNEKSNYKHKKEGIMDEHLSDNQKLMKNYIIQDKAYLEMNDKGMCLSMHQPWASLLVLGIKKHEGRTWYTPHRGTLWIASTGKIPEPETIKEVENFYEKYYEGLTVKFPKKYPTGVLLGNVLVQDCLGQEEYREEFPNGESDSSYVFICSDPNKLVVPIPVKGSHKIWRIKSEIHVMAKDALLLKKRFAK